VDQREYQIIGRRAMRKDRPAGKETTFEGEHDRRE
jgi:hypothetical protein